MSFELLIHSDTSNNNTDFADDSGNGLDVSATGPLGVFHSTAHPKFGTTCLDYFTGNYKSLTVGGAAHDFGFSDRDWTIDFWMYYDNSSSEGDLVMQWASGNNSNSVMYLSHTSGNWFFSLYVGSSQVFYAVSKSTYVPTLSGWNHIALIRDGGTLRAYINGVATNTQAISGSINAATTDFFIGGDGSYSPKPECWIDEFCIRLDEAIDFSSTGVPTAPYSTVVETTGDGAGDISNMMAVHDQNLEPPFEILFHPDTDTNMVEASENAYAVDKVGTVGIQGGSSKFGAYNISFYPGSSFGHLTIDSPNHDLQLGTKDFTIDFWIKDRGSGSFGEIIYQGDGTNANSTVRIKLWAGLIRFYVYEGTTEHYFDITRNLTLNEWHHIALVRKGATLKGYQDGAVENTYNIASAIINSGVISELMIGGEAEPRFDLDEIAVRFFAVDFERTGGAPTEEYTQPLNEGAGDVSEITGTATGTVIIVGNAAGEISEIGGLAHNYVYGDGAGNVTEIYGGSTNKTLHGAGPISDMVGAALAKLERYGIAQGSISDITGAGFGAGTASGEIQEIHGEASAKLTKIGTALGAFSKTSGQAVGTLTHYAVGNGSIKEITGAAATAFLVTGSAAYSIARVTGNGYGMAGLQFNAGAGEIMPVIGSAAVQGSFSFGTLRHVRGQTR